MNSIVLAVFFLGFRHLPSDCMKESKHRIAWLLPCEILTNGAAACETKRRRSVGWDGFYVVM